MKTAKKGIRKILAVILAMMVIMQLVCINAFAAGAPAVPTELSAELSDAAVTLTWKEVTGATNYTIKYGNISANLDNSVTATGSTIVISSLNNGTKYYFAICANNDTASSAYSEQVDARPQAITLGTPFGLNPTAGDCQVVLDWSDVYLATNYTIRYWTTDKAQALTVNTPDSVSAMTLTGLINGMTYHFEVCAYNSSLTSDYSTLSVSATPYGASALDVPTGLSAIATDGQVNLDWTDVTGATGYTIKYGTTSGALTSTATSTVSNIGINCTNDTTWYFAVCANNATISSAYTTEVNAKPLAATQYAAPTGLSATPGNKQVALTWLAPSASGVTSYTVSYGTTPGALSATTNVNTTYTTVTGLSNDTTYYFAVRANYGSSVSAYTAEVSAVPTDATTLSAPTGLTAIAADGRVNLDWADVTGATSYIVKYGTAAGALTSTAASPLSNIAINCTNGTTYYFAVCAKNATTTSAYTAIISAMPSALGVPTGLTAVGADGRVNLDWADVTGATDYTVKYGTTTGALTSTVTATASNIAINCTNGTTYYFAVCAKNATTTSAYTAIVSAMPSALGVPTGLTAVGADGRVNLDWADVTGATGYTVKYGTTSGALTSTVTSTASNIAINCSNGTTYYFAVCAKNATTTSAYTAIVSAIPSPLSVPTGLTAIGADGRVNLYWADVTGATGYTIKYGTSSGALTSTASSTVSNIAINCTNGTTYYFAVCAKNATTTSAYTAVVSAMPSVQKAVSYNGNGSTGGTVPATVSIETGKTITVSGNTGILIKSGFRFTGWNTKADGTGTSYQAGSTFTIGSQDIVLFAKWTSAKTIIYSGDNWAANGVDDYIVAYGTSDHIIVPTSYMNAGKNTVPYATPKTGEYAAKYNFVGFDDIKEDYWASKFIWFLSARDVIQGVGDNQFAPQGVLTRAEFIKILACLTPGNDTSAADSSGFSDVSAKDWFAPYVIWGVKQGIATGYGDGRFGPNDAITREQMCVMLAKYCDYLGYSFGDLNTSKTFSDMSSISSWSAAAVDALQKSGLIAGKENNMFAPQANSTRAEAATITCKLLKCIINNMENPKEINWVS